MYLIGTHAALFALFAVDIFTVPVPLLIVVEPPVLIFIVVKDGFAPVNLASGTVPLPRFEALSAVKFTPLAAGNVAGKTTLGKVPLVRLLALSAERSAA